MDLAENAAPATAGEAGPGDGPGFPPGEAARAALRAGVRLPAERCAEVAAVARHLHAVLAPLRELDLGETPPADHTTEREPVDVPR
ncbi:hypothetical protein [Streptomyces catenulae]|uniref:Uncharacterized protein n=1 Tax=Streptomyces catenulae TaxID=66875 RepID=A0ABV2YYD1_9ACTN|nr:hypothetical protein [Streptomyces catenulae]